MQDQARNSVISSLENNLANELERRGAAKIRDEQERIRICDKSEDLRALRIKLNEARVSRERAAQLLEQQLRYEEDKFRESLLDERMEEERLHILEEEKGANIRREHQRREANSMQKQQIEERERLRVENQREAALEKAQVDALVEKLRKEEEDETIARHTHLMNQRKIFQDFAELRDIQRLEDQERREKELAEIMAFEKAKKDREDRFEAKKREIENEKKRIQAQLLNQHADRDRRAAEQEYLLNQLHAEEKEEQDRLKELAVKEKILRDRVDMLRSYESQLAEKEARKQQELEEEMAFRKTMLQKFADEDKIEQFSNEKRRLKIRDHMQKASELWEVRKAAFEAEKQAELNARQKEIEARERELAIIEDERRRLLCEAAELRKFLPPGVLKSKDDVSMINSVLSKNFQTLKLN